MSRTILGRTRVHKTDPRRQQRRNSRNLTAVQTAVGSSANYQLLSGQQLGGIGIYLHGPRKSVPQITKLGNIFKTNFPVDQELCPTGKGFYFIVDLVAVYYTLEQDNHLPDLPTGYRAISAVAVPYTIVNHDYLRMAGYELTYSKIIAAMKSASYKKEVRKYERAETISPINLTKHAIFMAQTFDSDRRGYNLLGILVLLHHAFLNQSATKKLLQQKDSDGNPMYPDLSSHTLSYNIVRATAVLAGESRPVPDPIALLAHINCANTIFQRWTIHNYNSTKRTDELCATCYSESDVKGQKVISIEYDLRSVAKGFRPCQSLQDNNFVAVLRASCYGHLLPDVNVVAAIKMPLSPIDEARSTVLNCGYYPSIKVSRKVLPLPKNSPISYDHVNNIDHFDELQDEFDEGFVDTDDDSSDDERSITGLLSGSENESDEELDYDE